MMALTLSNPNPPPPVAHRVTVCWISGGDLHALRGVCTLTTVASISVVAWTNIGVTLRKNIVILFEKKKSKNIQITVISRQTATKCLV